MTEAGPPRTPADYAAMGRLASGMAHEMNNLLQPVIGLAAVELALLPETGGTAAQQDSRENLALILECGQRLSEMVREILACTGSEAAPDDDVPG